MKYAHAMMSMRSITFTKRDIRDDFNRLCKSNTGFSFSVLDITRMRTEIFAFITRIRAANEKSCVPGSHTPSSLSQKNEIIVGSNSIFQTYHGPTKTYKISGEDNYSYPSTKLDNNVTVANCELPRNM